MEPGPVVRSSRIPASSDDIGAACGGFEGNVQTLRILTRLEPKVGHGEGAGGLNLTRATLEASCKYPWGRRGDTRTFGVHEADRAVFDWMRAGAPEGRCSIEAQVMERRRASSCWRLPAVDAVRGFYAPSAPGSAHVALLTAVALRYVMSDPGRLAMQARQRELLAELAAALLAGAPGTLDPVRAED